VPGTKRRANLVSISDDVPKVEDRSQGGAFFSKLRRWPRQHSINAKEKKDLYEGRKKELGTDDESKLVRITLLAPKGMDQKAKRDRVR
jgi:hypothetical protein